MEETLSSAEAVQKHPQQQLSLDEAWENLCIHPHQVEQEEGRRQGREAGSKAGFVQGYRLGRTTALDYGMEIGFIRGVLTALEEHGDEQPAGAGNATVQQRIRKSMISLRGALDEFPGPDVVFQSQAAQPGRAAMGDQTNIFDSDGEHNPVEDDADSSLDVAGTMQLIRVRFKLLTVQLGIPHFSLKQIMDEAARASSNAGINEIESKSDKNAIEDTSAW